jgi:hypothetical protein
MWIARFYLRQKGRGNAKPPTWTDVLDHHLLNGMHRFAARSLIVATKAKYWRSGG